MCGPGTQPELGQNLSKVVAQRWADKFCYLGGSGQNRKLFVQGGMRTVL